MRHHLSRMCYQVGEVGRELIRFYPRLPVVASPMSDLFGKKGRRWLAAQSLSDPHRQLVDLLSNQVGSITQAITEIEEGLRHTLAARPRII